MSTNDPFVLKTKDMVGGVTESALATNKLIRNTYMLLSMTLLFSAFTAGLAMVFKLPHPGFILTLVGFIGLFFLTSSLRNSVWGLAAVFALTGFMGLTIGPVINAFIHTYSNGHELVIMAFGMTAMVFLGLSGYALTTKKGFSFLNAALFAGLIVAIVGIAGVFVLSLFGIQVGGMQLAISGLIVLLMAGFMLYDTSNIVHGYETNYIMATVTLYVDIYNMFLNLLAIFGLWGEE